MLKPIQQRQLIEQDGTERKTLSVEQALCWYLTVTVEDALELLVEFSMANERSLWNTRRTSTPSPVCG